jgi:MoxR-like ATPase
MQERWRAVRPAVSPASGHNFMRNPQEFNAEITHQNRMTAARRDKQNLFKSGSLKTAVAITKLWLTFEDSQTNQDHTSEFILLNNGGIFAYHDCPAVRKRNTCWHLALAQKTFVAAGHTVTNCVTVQIKNPDTSAVEFEMQEAKASGELRSVGLSRGSIWIATHAAVPEPVVEVEEEAPPVVPEKLPMPEIIISDLHPDDVWLESLALPPVLYAALVTFRARQRARLLSGAGAVHLVPNLGMADSASACRSSLTFALKEDAKHLLDYVPPSLEMAAWALSPLLHQRWEPVLVSGAAGTGKTVLAHYLAAVLCLPLAIYCGNSQSGLDSLLGEKELAPDTDHPGGMRICHAPGVVLNAIRDGAFLCFNEINIVPPDVAAFLNDILDFQKSTYVHGVGRVDVSPDFRLVATRNKGYYGTAEMNQATLDRFREIDASYPDAETVKAVIALNAPALAPAQIERVATLYGNLVHACTIKRGMIGPEHISLRSVIRAAKDIAVFGENQRVVLRNMLSGIDDPPAAEVITQVVQSVYTGGA